MKKKIIFVTKALWIGGIETALVNLLNCLDYEKYDVACLILRDEKPMAERLPKQVRLIVADRDRTASFSQSYRFPRLFHLTEETDDPSRLHRAMMWAVPAIKWVENRLYIRYVRRQMQNEHFDTCIIYSDVAAETAVRAVQADQFLMFYHHGAMRRVYHDEIAYKKCSMIIAVSKHQEEKLRQFRPKYADKMMSIHNIVNVAEIREKAKAPIPEQFSEDQFNIVTCGRVSREKGMDLAVEACVKLVETGHQNIRWWIVGGGPAEQEVRDRITQLGMEQYVTMVGMKDNPYPYIARADLYVQPSRFESYGLTIAEAMVLGRFVVSTNTDGAMELLSGNAGVKICTIDTIALTDAVRAVIAGEVDGKLNRTDYIEKENAENLGTFCSLIDDN